MPKQTLKISNFTGGMNTELDARDIENNEFAYLESFTGSDAGILKVGGQFCYISDDCAGVGATADEAANSHMGKYTFDTFSIPRLPDSSGGGAWGLFTFNSDYNILANNSSTFTPTQVLCQFSRYNSAVSAWEYFGNGEQQSESTGAGVNINGCVNGFLPIDFTSSALKPWWRLYDSGVGYSPKNDMFRNGEGWSSPKNNANLQAYAPDGTIRTCWANHEQVGNQPKWFGYIPRKKYGVQDSYGPTGGICSVNVGGGWMIENAGVEKGPARISTKMLNSSCLKGSNQGPGADMWTGDVEAGDYTNPAGVYNNSTGVSLDFREAVSSTSTTTGEGSGDWQPTINTRYKFYTTYLYDEIKQESHPTLFIMYPTCAEIPYEGGAQWPDSLGPDSASAQYGNTIGDSNFAHLGAGSPEMYFCGVDTNEDATQGSGVTTIFPTEDNIVLNQSVYFKPVLRLHGAPPGAYALTPDGDGWTVTPDSSLLTAANDAKSIGWSTDISGEEKYIFGGRREGGNIAPHSRQGNQRITGMRIYYSSNLDGHKELYAMFELDFVKGVKAYGMGVETTGAGAWAPWEPYIEPNLNRHSNHPPVWGNMRPGWSKEVQFEAPPTTDTYSSLNQRPHDVATAAAWKTSAFVKGRMYIANYRRPLYTAFETASVWYSKELHGPTSGAIRQPWIGLNRDSSGYDFLMGGDFWFPRDSANNYGGPYGEGTTTADFVWEDVRKEVVIKTDTICKSPAGEYDIFPATPEYEMTFGESDDGDEIVHLDTTHDKLLVFKRNSLLIIVPGDPDQVESTNLGLGLEGQMPAQVCKTDFGIAWVNSSGCYHYDGSQIKSLSAKKIDNFIQNGGHNALPFNTSTNNSPSNIDKVRSLRWTVPETWMAPMHSKYAGNPKYPHGDINQSLGFDRESKKLIWLKNAGWPSTAIGQDNSQWATADEIADSLIYSDATIGNPMFYGDVLVYDFRTDSWAFTRGAYQSNRGVTNFVNFKNKLIFMNRTTNDPLYIAGGQVTSDGDYRMWQWVDNPMDVIKKGPWFSHVHYYTKNPVLPVDASIITKDFDFGDPGRRKKIYKIYITYRVAWDNANIKVKYRTDGSNAHWDDSYELAWGQQTVGTSNIANPDSNELYGPTKDYGWETISLKPTTSSEANNIYSFQLYFKQHEPDNMRPNGTYTDPGTSTEDIVENAGQGYVNSSFEINDITIVYRMKGVN